MPKTIDQFAGSILAVCQKYADQPKGTAVDITGDNMVVKAVSGLLPFQRFMEEQTTTDVSTSDLFTWFTRMTLRNVGPFLIGILVKYVIPALSDQDAKLRVQHANRGKIIDLKGARACWLRYQWNPDKPEKSITYFTIEDHKVTEDMDLDHDITYRHHLFLYLLDGSIVDLMMAQLSGDTQQPKYYESLAALEEAFPLKVSAPGYCGFFDDDDISELFDPCDGTIALARIHAEMVENYAKGWKAICRNCFNFAEKLKTCGGCKKVKYCGKFCQDLHWQEHKTICTYNTV